MPTQMPKNGRPRAITASLTASSSPGTAASPRRQSAKAPWPGSTMRSAAAASSARLVTMIVSVPPISLATRSNAFAAERRLPEP
jgi:hypothetical protein